MIEPEWTPEEREEIKARAAKLLRDKILEEVGCNDRLDEVHTMPLSHAAALLMLSYSRAKEVLPVVDFGDRQQRVTWEDIKSVVAMRRKPPICSR